MRLSNLTFPLVKEAYLICNAVNSVVRNYLSKHVFAINAEVLSAIYQVRNQTREAITWFDRALATDSALGNAWLGRGLCRIRLGHAAEGREDLLVAAALPAGKKKGKNVAPPAAPPPPTPKVEPTVAKKNDPKKHKAEPKKAHKPAPKPVKKKKKH